MDSGSSPVSDAPALQVSLLEADHVQLSSVERLAGQLGTPASDPPFPFEGCLLDADAVQHSSGATEVVRLVVGFLARWGLS